MCASLSASIFLPRQRERVCRFPFCRLSVFHNIFFFCSRCKVRRANSSRSTRSTTTLTNLSISKGRPTFHYFFPLLFSLYLHIHFTTTAFLLPEKKSTQLVIKKFESKESKFKSRSFFMYQLFKNYHLMSHFCAQILETTRCTSCVFQQMQTAETVRQREIEIEQCHIDKANA